MEEVPEPVLEAISKFKLTEAQEGAVEVAHKLVKDAVAMKTSVGRLTGYAGTGKTTVIRSIADLVGGVLLLAPTGKAAVRIQELTGLAAQTIHKWLYFPKDEVPAVVKDKDGNVVKTDAAPKLKLTWTRKPPDLIVVPPSRLIIIDEASMLGPDVWKDVQQTANLFGCNVLLVGDSGQLPPVSEVKGYSPLEHIPVDYQIHLTEVVRQALDSPIIMASKLVREGQIDQALKYFHHYQREMVPEVAEWLADHGGVSIVHSNRARHQINTAVRARKKYEREAVTGEPLLVVKNCYDLNIFNGEVIQFGGWRRRTKAQVVVNNFYEKKKIPSHFGLANLAGERAVLADEVLHGNMDGVGDKVFFSAMDSVGKALEMSKDSMAAYPFVRANFGYALTCHKAQGSEWPIVLVVLENSMPLGEPEGRTWLYTAITRAKEAVVLARI